MAGGSLVYFPMLSIPEGSWLARHLLYWDRLLVPTPVAVARRPEENFDAFTRELMDRDLVAYAFPEDHLSTVHRVSEAFANAVQGSDIEVRQARLSADETFGIHQGKTTSDLLGHLGTSDSLRPARTAGGAHDCARVHGRGRERDRRCDRRRHGHDVRRGGSGRGRWPVAGDLDLARRSLLGEVLPSPETFDFDTLVALRRHRDELIEFRAETERYANLVAYAASAEDADRWRTEYVGRAAKAERDLVKYMSAHSKSSRLVKGPHGSLLAGRFGAVVGTLQALAGFQPDPAPPHPGFAYSAQVHREF